MAGKVYDINRPWSDTLEAEIEANYIEWLTVAQEESAPKLTLDDVVGAVLELGELFAEQDDAIVELAGLIEGGM